MAMQKKRMKDQLVQFSVVVTGDVHNPTILNPDFLTAQGIVPKDWGWEVTETITTPPFAVVRFSNGVSITVEHNKLQVTDLGSVVDPQSSKVADISRAYVRVLPHVRYKAVGHNFNSIVEVKEPDKHLKNRFLKKGDWDSRSHPLSAVGLRLVYPLAEGRIILSLDVGEAEREHEGQLEKRPVIIANANFHRECKKYPACDEIGVYLKKIDADWAKYQAILYDTIGLED